ncbi:MAG: DUF4340 domain-containing protein [Polyangiaceae bacterium]|nr:DUF4340 domain-containing protein [Polyangiaceae bacterium]
MTPWWRRHLTTIVLVALAGAGSAVLLLDRDNPTTQESEYRKKNLVPAWRLEDISEVTLTAHGKTAKLVLGPPTDAGQRLWDVELAGGRFLANQQMVDQLLGSLEYATFERRVSADAVSESELGLAAPVTAVSVRMGSKVYTVKVGGVAPTPKDARYCEAEGGIFVITAQLATALNMQPEALRSRFFVPYLSTELKGIWVEGAGGTRHFVRASWTGSRGAGFRFDGSTPEGTVRADAEVFDRFLGALGGLQAETFLSDEEADKALEKKVTITLFPKNETQPKAVIEVGGACPGKSEQVVAVRRLPSRTSACVPEGVVEGLATPVGDYVDLSLVGARSDEVSELVFEAGGKTIEIARTGGAWHMRKPDDRKVSSDAGNALADALTKLKGAKVVLGEPKDLGLETPRAKVKVVSSSLGLGSDSATIERIETLEVGEKQGDRVVVRRLEDGVMLELAAEQAAMLLPSEVMLRDRGVLALARDRAKSVHLEDRSGAAPKKQVFTKTETGWAFQDAPVKGLSPDAGFVEDVLSAVVKLNALRWVAPKDDGTFGFEKPRFVIEVKVTEGDAADVKTIRIELGGATHDGVFARTGLDPAVFVAPRALEEVASKWLFDRQALLIDDEALVRIDAEAGGKHLTAEKEGGAWKSASGADAAATLRAAASGLVSEGVVAIGAPDKSFGLEKPRLVLTVTAEPEQGAPKGSARRTLKISFGAGDSVRGVSVVYARREGIDATFIVPTGKVRALFDAAEVK